MLLSSANGLRALQPTTNRRVPAPLFAATILLSAFLLFQVQPLIAKLILPWFGGSAAVWTSCMLFFQIALLGGYGYAHWLNGQSPKRQTTVHLVLMVISFIALPILPSPWWKPQGADDPLLRILGLLTATVGLPYFLLSSTSPLLQTWYSRSNGGAMPYRFFALSNAGSMLGLLTYPVLVEPYLTNQQQAWMWSVTYVAFVAVCSLVAWRSRSFEEETGTAKAAGPAAAPPMADRLIWMSLAACASALLLSITNHLTQNVAAIPFLWVLPLSLYLLSFILCFDSDRWYKRWIFTRLSAVALPSIAYAISSQSSISDLKLALPYFCTAMFILFMVFHGELARRRPAPAYVTSFYLMVSVGGAVGGLLIGFAAPYFLNALYDLQIVVCLSGFLLAYLLWRGRQQPDPEAVSTPFLDAPFDKAVIGGITCLMVLYIVVRVFQGRSGGEHFLNAPYDTRVLLGFAGALVLYVLWRGRDSVNEGVAILAIAVSLSIGMAGYLARDTWNTVRGSRVLVRNFYGALNVYDEDSTGKMGQVRVLKHGTIDHGEEFLWPQNSRFATTYYSAGSGVGRALRTLQIQGPLNVGVVGLGAGTLSTYARPVDHYTIFDINPVVMEIAQKEFRFLRQTMAPKQLILGDARLSLDQRASEPKFDLLAVDAFSGDAIPVHLLTREAFALYWRRLKPDGVLAVHVSNRFLDLGPVVALGAEESGRTARMFSNDEDSDTEVAAADWVLVTKRPGFFDQEETSFGTKIKPIPGLRVWTDDYSNLYKILR